MFKTLYARLALALGAVLIIIGLVFVTISSLSTSRYMQELAQKLNTDLAKNLVAERNLVKDGKINDEAIVETFYQFMSINPSIEIYLLDLEGNIKSYSADPGRVKLKSVKLKPINDFLNMSEPFPLLGDDPRSLTRQKAFSVTAIPDKENPTGYLYVVLRGEQYDFVENAVRDSYIFRLSLWAVAISLFAGLLSGLAVFRALMMRRDKLSKMMLVFGENGLTPSDINEIEMLQGSGDDVDKLSVAFLDMVRRISDQLVQLEEKDNLRRNLIAQAWHDLRTPLASMQGYVESIRIKGDKLTRKQQHDFLDIALKQGNRLGDMVEELVVLASLDAREPVPDLEIFALVELLYDVVQKHDLGAQKKKVTMTIAAAPDLPSVFGTVAMTERILDNLLRNALAYSPHGGHIDLALKKDGDWLEVSLSDNGPGIAQEDLPHVFEPFYRGKSQLPTDQDLNPHGSGLGLAIAKRMVTLQGGEIAVRSDIAGSSVFTFKLKTST